MWSLPLCPFRAARLRQPALPHLPGHQRSALAQRREAASANPIRGDLFIGWAALFLVRVILPQRWQAPAAVTDTS